MNEFTPITLCLTCSRALNTVSQRCCDRVQRIAFTRGHFGGKIGLPAYRHRHPASAQFTLLDESRPGRIDGGLVQRAGALFAACIVRL